MTIPGYWPNETSGVLVPVVRAYLEGVELDVAGVATMRAYLRQWIEAPAFVGADVDELRAAVDELVTTDDVRAWLERAVDAGVDPL